MEFFEVLPLAGFLLFTIILVGRVIYLRYKNIRVSSMSGIQQRYIYLLYLGFGLLFLIWLTELINLAFQWQVYTLPIWLTKKITDWELLSVAGSFLISVSLLLLTITLLHFKKSLRFGLDENNQGELITNGIFSLSRNPFFISINIYFAGLAMLHPSIFFIVLSLLSLVGIHFFILKEEKFLQMYHGKKYNRYFNRVGRYF